MVAFSLLALNKPTQQHFLHLTSNQQVQQFQYNKLIHNLSHKTHFITFPLRKIPRWIQSSPKRTFPPGTSTSYQHILVPTSHGKQAIKLLRTLSATGKSAEKWSLPVTGCWAAGWSSEKHRHVLSGAESQSPAPFLP